MHRVSPDEHVNWVSLLHSPVKQRIKTKSILIKSNKTASSKILQLGSKFFDHTQYSQNVSTMVKSKIYLMNLYVWARSKIFEHLQKNIEWGQKIFLNLQIEKTQSHNLCNGWQRAWSTKWFETYFRIFQRLQWSNFLKSWHNSIWF